MTYFFLSPPAIIPFLLTQQPEMRNLLNHTLLVNDILCIRTYVRTVVLVGHSGEEDLTSYANTTSQKTCIFGLSLC